MRTVRRLLYGDIVSSVLFVAAAFLSLFFFIDVVDSLEDVGRDGLGVGHVVLGAVYLLPGHLYELMPIAVLIGSIYALARMAQSSEFTILRTGGLGPGRALGLLAVLGLAFAAFTFVVGDYLTPASERQAVLLKARQAGGLKVGGAGAWLKERRSGPEGERSFSINLQGTGAGGQLLGVRIYEFDADGRLRQRLQARTATVDDQGQWMLQDVDSTRWPQPATARPSAWAAPGASGSGRPQTAEAAAAAQGPVAQAHHDSLAWPSTLKPAVVAAAVLPLETMTTVDLWRYSRHLDVQAQSAQTHQIRFWRKALYPLACLVMVALALPFAYLHARAGGVSLKVFGGILLGISFVLLNNVAGHLGLLRGWTPWMAAATPSFLYLLMSLAAFAWLVRFR